MNNVIVVRGAGDLATAVICKLHKCGYKVLALEVNKPLAIRRQVALSEAVYEGQWSVEGVTCKLCKDKKEIKNVFCEGNVALMVDPEGLIINEIKPSVVVDAILAKVNIGTNKSMAKLTIGLGPGFSAGDDVDVVIETMRGHNLGRVILNGKPKENTGIPGIINGMGRERVVYSPCEGTIKNVCKIGDIVKKGDIIAYVIDKEENKHEVIASIDGLLRGLIRDGSFVKSKLKILDIDPRIDEINNSYTISDKGRCIAGGVLEAILSHGVLPNN